MAIKLNSHTHHNICSAPSKHNPPAEPGSYVFQSLRIYEVMHKPIKHTYTPLIKTTQHTLMVNAYPTRTPNLLTNIMPKRATSETIAQRGSSNAIKHICYLNTILIPYTMPTVQGIVKDCQPIQQGLYQ